MATASGEGLDATARVMYRGCSICCAFVTIFMLMAVVQSILAPYYSRTQDEILLLIILMVLAPMLMSVILYRMSRQKRKSLADTSSGDWSGDWP
ncbi:MAG: hypothetical protein ACFFER_06100 [Candidatus Thorarchaeota archaeon]